MREQVTEAGAVTTLRASQRKQHLTKTRIKRRSRVWTDLAKGSSRQKYQHIMGHLPELNN